LGVILDPSGESLGVSIDLLNNSPFENFIIPGIFLFVVNGLSSLFISYITLQKHRKAGIATIFLGIVMIIWIILQAYWIGWINWLQPTFLIIGVVEVILGYLLSTHYRFYGRKFWNHFGKFTS